jgi:tetratricopeptide (TPR) repeat protein
MRKGFALLIMVCFALATLLESGKIEDKNEKFSVFEFEKYIIENDFVVRLTEQQVAEYNKASVDSLELFSERWNNTNIIVPVINPAVTGNLSMLPKRGYIVNDQKLLKSFSTPEKYKIFVRETIGPGGITIACANAFFINISPIRKYEERFDLLISKSPEEKSALGYLLSAMINETAHLYIGAYLPESFGKLTYMSNEAKELLHKATVEFTSGNFESAKDGFILVREKCPALANAANLAALSERRLGNYEASSKLYEISISIQEKSLDARMNHLLNQYELGNFEEMQSILEGISTFVGESPEYFFWKAVLGINKPKKEIDVERLLEMSASLHYENNRSIGIQSDLVLIGRALHRGLTKQTSSLQESLNSPQIERAMMRIKEYCDKNKSINDFYGKTCKIDNPSEYLQNALNTYSNFRRR